MKGGDAGTAERLSQLRRSHARLCEVVPVLNATFSPALLFALATSFFLLVSTLYYTVIGGLSLSDTYGGSDGYFLALYAFGWATLGYGRFLILSYSCQTASTEVRLLTCDFGLTHKKSNF